MSVELPMYEEKPKFTPSLSMRPHHLFLPYVQDALTGKSDPYMLASQRADMLATYRDQTGDPFGYYADRIGTAKQNQLNCATILSAYLTTLKNLQDSEYIQFDLQPDGICDSASIGIHCMATNYRGTHEPGDVVQAEYTKLTDIKLRLANKRFREGTDYVTKDKPVALYDLGGSPLNNYKIISGELVTFQSLIVQVNAIREILD